MRIYAIILNDRIFLFFPQLREVRNEYGWTSFLGWLICIVESFFLILGLYYRINLKKLLWIVYSVILLTINIVPAVLIAPGENLFWDNSAKTMFVISSISAIISVVTLGINISACINIDEDCIATSGASFISVSAMVMLVIVMVSITRPNNRIVELETKSYENYYEISIEDGASKILYVCSEDSATGYYVVMYDSIGEDGQTRLNVVQISPQNVDIVYAFEGQEKDYLIVYTIEVIKEDRNKDPYEIISEKTYSYKLVIRKGVPIIRVMPIE